MRYMVPEAPNPKRTISDSSRLEFTYSISFATPADELKTFKVCVKTFRGLFNIGETKLKTLRKKIKEGRSCVAFPKKSGKKPMDSIIEKKLIAVLETEPRETSHYALQDRDNSRRYYFSGELSLFHFWKVYLRNSGKINDEAFLAQAESKNFYPGYHKITQVTRKPEYSIEEPQLKPSVSYEYARRLWSDYDIKFEARKCDICQTCFRLRSDVQAIPPNNPVQVNVANKALFDHQKSAALCVWVRREWRRCTLTHMFRREHLQVDFAANPRCPYMDLNQAFYSRILGVSVFVVCSALVNETFVYYFDETTAKKGSDEVVSLMHYHVEHHIPTDIKELDVHCDGCAGQSWNNHLALFFEELIDPLSDIMPTHSLGRIDLYRGISGHTYMQPDTEGGRIQREAKKVLLMRGGGFVHTMRKDPTQDPPYTVAWVDLADNVDNINPVTPGIEHFHEWSKFLLPPEKKGTSILYCVPTPKHCFRGPHSVDNSWRITRSHHLNFGIGENINGLKVQHSGVWFSRDRMDQEEPDEVFCRRIGLWDSEEWARKRVEVRGHRPTQKQTELMSLSLLKQDDLYGLGKIMSRDTEGKDFAKSYPNPVNSSQERTAAEEDEMLTDIKSILRKNESTWTSQDYYDLLRWKMQKNYSQFKSKQQRKQKWDELFSMMQTPEQEEINSVSAGQVESVSIILSQGADIRRDNENEHVDNDEFLGHDTPPFNQKKYQREITNLYAASMTEESRTTFILREESEQETLANDWWNNQHGDEIFVVYSDNDEEKE